MNKLAIVFSLAAFALAGCQAGKRQPGRRRRRQRFDRRRLDLRLSGAVGLGGRLQNQAGTKVNYQSIGSGGGIAQIKAGTVDFGATDKPLASRRTRRRAGSPSSRS